MRHINDENGASAITSAFASQVLREFKPIVYGAEFGIAYGGGIERIGKLWHGKGIVYGFDTFEGHPKQIGDICEYSKSDGGQSGHAAICMDRHYKRWGMSELSYDYIQSQLARQGLNNVTLIKGLITDKTDISYIERLHYCFIDLDFPLSILDAYNLVKDKIVKGGYLLLHDLIPDWHIKGGKEVYSKILSEGLFKIVLEVPESFLCILKRK